MLLRRLVVVLSCLIVADVGVAAEPPLTLTTFRVDVTPPIGDGPCVGCMPKVSSIEHPLELRGIVLRAGCAAIAASALGPDSGCRSRAVSALSGERAACSALEVHGRNCVTDGGGDHCIARRDADCDANRWLEGEGRSSRLEPPSASARRQPRRASELYARGR